MRNLIITGLVVALISAACGGSTVAAPTTTIETDDATTEMAVAPAEFRLAETDDGAVLRVHPGDAIRMSLPIEDPVRPLWIIAEEPDPSIVAIADSLLWTPSEPRAEPTLFEFVFLVVGTGETRVTFSLGPLTPTARTIAFTVLSS